MLKWFEQVQDKNSNIICCKVRLARNWSEYVFPSKLSDEDGRETEVQTTGVYCVVGVTAVFKPVEVLYSGEGFVLLRSASTRAGRILRSGDEVIVTARDLYDGKVIRE